MVMRLDQHLLELGYARSRSQAQALIKAGNVSIDGTIVKKPSHPCPPNLAIAVSSNEITRFVSRGGLKLQGALEHTNVNPTGFTVLDVGQSTGGFTDCLLQAGAAKVVGIDVGRDQLVQTLRDDERVVFYEGINARELPIEQLLSETPNELGFDLAVMDVSFISQTLILSSLVPLLKPGALLLSLVKPQFELQPQHIGKNGLVKTSDDYPLVEAKIRAALNAINMKVLDYYASAIEGGDGNQEFFVFAIK